MSPYLGIAHLRVCVGGLNPCQDGLGHSRLSRVLTRVLRDIWDDSCLPGVKHQFSTLGNQGSSKLRPGIALCSYPHVNVSIRDFSQILTTTPIFLYSNYFRQKYLKIARCAVPLLNNIWVQVEHSLLQQPNLKENKLQFKQFAGMM